MKPINHKAIEGKVDIIELAAELGIDMKQSGRYTFIRCPYHFKGEKIDQKISNCFINPDHTRYYCKSCGNSGSAITMVMQTLDMSYINALKWLSNYTDIPIQYAFDGDIIEDEDGEKVIFREVVHSKDLEFLGVKNGSAWGTSVLMTSWKEAHEYSGSAVIDEDGNILGYVQKTMLCANPLQDLAQHNYEAYLKIIKKFIKLKYDNICERYHRYIGTIMENDIDVSTAEDIAQLRTIASNIGIDPNNFPKPKKAFHFDLDIDEGSAF